MDVGKDPRCLAVAKLRPEPVRSIWADPLHTLHDLREAYEIVTGIKPVAGSDNRLVMGNTMPSQVHCPQASVYRVAREQGVGECQPEPTTLPKRIVMWFVY